MNADVIVVGLISGVVSSVTVMWLQHHFVWRRQKLIELKTAIFQDAIRALGMYAADALDTALQASKTTHKGLVQTVASRPETGELMERSRGMVQAFFSPATYKAYDEALREIISLDNIPNQEFDKKRAVAVLAMAKELGIIPNANAHPIFNSGVRDSGG